MYWVILVYFQIGGHLWGFAEMGQVGELVFGGLLIFVGFGFMFFRVFYQQIMRNIQVLQQVLTQYTPLPPPKTHQSLILRIKLTLSLPNPTSSFLPRSNLLLYLQSLHTENQLIKASLDPPALSSEIQQLQRECEQLREILAARELEQGRLRRELAGLGEQIGFMGEYLAKNGGECEDVEREIQGMLEENSVNLSNSSSEKVSNLMERFMGYFEGQQEQQPSSQHPHTQQPITQQPQEKNETKNIPQIAQQQKKEEAYEGSMMSSQMNGDNTMYVDGEGDGQDSGSGVRQPGASPPQLDIVNYTYTGFQ